ncbi:MAG: DNA helicase UvrD [Bacteroidetes bacterium]|nr:MAG: DNA helicase UvrD [Bacteroidota bacterium]
MNQREKFELEYRKLNSQQKLAVDTIDGPVMVIAGPGTGKTQILSARIGKILLETDTRPENILCLTYTDAGVVAMRKRLVEFIGPDAYKVNIYTFHAFCNDIIQENLSLFEKNQMDPVSELERIRYLRELIDSFPKNHPLKRYRSDAYFEIKNLRSLFSNMKREGWTPAFINEKIDNYLASLDTRDKFIYQVSRGNNKKGDPKVNDLNAERERMEKLRAAANEFDHFQLIMRKHNRYDFDDMINWVIQSFEKDENLLRKYQEKYLYTLVDEYQDTSGTQNRLVQLLINYWERPNVFVVGDDDQSIFRFQGASVVNMQSFDDTYSEDLMKVVLTNNYRSTQPVLDISKTLINRNTERLIYRMDGLDKDLIAANSSINHLDHWPKIRISETPRQEMIDITTKVLSLLEQNIPPGEIGIIYKENKYGQELMQYFKLKNIPYYSKRSINILEIPIAKKIILLLDYLATEHEISYSGDEMLFEILHFDWFHIPAIEIAQLSIEVANRQFSEKKVSFRRLLYEKSNEPARDLFTPAVNPNLKKASAIIEALIAEVPNTTLQLLMESMIRKAGILNFVMESPEKLWLLQVLGALFDYVQEETHRNPSMTLADLVKVFDMMEDEEIPLPLTQVNGSADAVNLLTAHGAKGLEFKHVFFAGCNSHIWEKKRVPPNGYKFPDTIFPASSNQSSEEELRRLFYVALTRAQLHLTISYSRFGNDGKDLEPSMFIAEIEDVHTLEKETVSISEDLQAEFQVLQWETEQAPEIERKEEEFINRLLESFEMNVTALNNYLRCPLEFYFKNLLRIPSPKNEATEFGSAVHFALENLFRQMQNDNRQQFPSLESFIGQFEWYMKRHRESFTKDQFDRRMEYGHIILTPYYEKYIPTWNKIVAIERNVRNVYNGIPLKGKLDKMEFDGKKVNVVDYKTGDPEKALGKLAPPSEKDPKGGDYWRQAVFYKILLDNYGHRSWIVESTEFDFIEPDKRKIYRKPKVNILPEHISAVGDQITDTWEKIHQHDFYTGCGKKECHWCNFVKTNNMAIALHELEDEA